MIDKRMYRETFSQLRASDQAKQEVLQKMQEMKQRKRMPRVLRGAALAAAMVMALAVTAGAVNVATDGALFRQFTIVWTSGDQYLARDDQGNAVSITLVDGDVVTEEDGRLILHVDGEDIDITEELETEGVPGGRQPGDPHRHHRSDRHPGELDCDPGQRGRRGLRDRRRQRRRGGLRHRHGTGGRRRGIAGGRRWQHGSETGPGRHAGGVIRAKKRGQGIPCPRFSVLC